MAPFCLRVLSRRLHVLRHLRSWRVLFFGTDKFSCDILQSLCNYRGTLTEGSVVISKLDVICQSQKCAVYQFATANHIKLLKWPLEGDLRDTYDVGILASFGHMISADVIQSFPFGVINVHPSLLPRWRGSSPIVYTILHGDQTTGVSIMQIHPHRFDRGPVLLQQEHVIPHDCDTPRLTDELSALGSQMLNTILADLPQYQQSATPQDHTLASYANKLKSDAANIDWQGQTMCDIRRLYNALHHTFDLRTEFHGKLVKLSSMTSPPASVCDISTPGRTVYSEPEEALCVGCEDGWVAFERIIVRKPMSARDFYNGYLTKLPTDQHYFTSLHNPVLSRTSRKPQRCKVP